MNPSDLSEESQDQIRKYLKFFRLKKDGVLRALSHEIRNLKSDRLHEEMFTKDDVEEMLEYLETSIKNQVSSDLSALINMGALSVSQLLETAYEKGLELSLDTSAIENHNLLAQVEMMSLDPSVPKAAKRNELVSFKDEAKARREESERLDAVNQRLQDEVAGLRARIAAMERQHSASESKLSSDSSTRVASLESALNEAKDENNRRVSDTTQFQQMRRMMQSQSVKIRDLRRRLQVYEPDICKEDDDA